MAAPLIRPAATFSPRSAKGEGSRAGIGRSARQSGVALIATLIMLSLVTFMVVAFLGVARRERRSIEAQTGQGGARSAQEAAFARAQAEIIAQLLVTGDKWNYGMIAPTNFQNTNAFNNTLSPTNVNHTNALALGLNAWLTNLGNLQYDPRLPVFSSYYTNRTPYDLLQSETNQGRFYLDFNRNGMFDSTDPSQAADPHWIGMLEYPDATHGRDNRGVGRYSYLVAPAGKALDLNLIHNQAKLQFPAAFANEGYYRNQNVGPQEMNTAALLAEVNPYWNYTYDTVVGNSSILPPAAQSAFGDARDLLLFRNNGGYDNNASLSAQFGVTAAQNLTNAEFNVFGFGPLMTGPAISSYYDGLNYYWPGGSNTSATAQRYFDLNELFLTNRSYANFTANLNYLGKTNEATSSPAGELNRRTFYKLLSSLGVESWPVTNKLNLNWSNAPFTGTNITLDFPGGDYSGFTGWHPDYFFFNTAELMIRASITPSVFINTNWTGFGVGTDPGVLVTNYYFGTSFLGTNFGILSVTNIPIFPFSYYTPEMHRLLQLTANLYDATTTNSASPAYPTLFRPYFAFNTNGWPSNDFIKIVGYTTNATDTGLLALPVYDLSDPNGRMALYQGPGATVSPAGIGSNQLCVVAGTPVIVGVKKGYPNFNEFGVQTIFSDTRRLEFVKTNATNIGPMSIAGMPLLQTNQSHVIGLTNIFGIEAWNSYFTAFPRDLRMAVTNVSYIVLTNEFGPLYTNIAVNGTNIFIGAGTWRGMSNGLASFKSFFFTNIPQLSATLAMGYAYATNYPPLAGFTNGGFIPASPTGPGSPSIFNRSNGFPDMKLGITITNSIRYALYEPNSNRVVDFVNLTGLVTGLDLAAALRVTNSTNDTGARFWLTNRVGGVLNPTLGISNQIALSLDTNVNSMATNLWRQYSLNTPILREIDRFRKWMGTNGPLAINQRPLSTNLTTIQAPFTPTRLVSFTATWEANDPLVHYTSTDLSDPYRVTLNDQVTPIIPPTTIAPPAGTLFRVDFGVFGGRFGAVTNGGVNRYCMPWGRPLDTTGSRLASLTNFYVVAPAAYDLRLKDPGVVSSEWWDFPQRKFANLGWIGRVHRGTPWQTVYLKSEVPNTTNWFYWAHSTETMPTNDWRLMDVFTTAINTDATRGLLSVNQTNSAAWAAALGGTLVLSNNGAGYMAMPITPTLNGASQLATIVGDLAGGIINAKQRVPMWNPVANYSAGDVVAYTVLPYLVFGDTLPHSDRCFVAVNGTNQNQNPLLQVTTNNFSYWVNAYFWSSVSNYSAGSLVVHRGVSYYSLINGNVNLLPDQSPGQWEMFPSRSFTRVGSVLGTPELSVQSPYLNRGQPWRGVVYATGARVYWQGWYYQALRPVPANQPPNPYWPYSDRRNAANAYWWPLESPAISVNAGTSDSLSDVFIERIPQQTLGLMQLEQSPRFVIYAYGQSLRPADRGVYVGSGAYQGMVTNYQITGEVASRAVVRVDGLPEPGFLPRPLPTNAPPQVTPRVVVESFKLLPADY
ncbi:MAG: hypothetical protein WCS99_06885 [Limisphaerales bacterium]